MLPLYSHIVAQLTGSYSREEASNLAYWILEETLGIGRAEVQMSNLSPAIPAIDTIISRLRAHEPIQYVFGHTLWRGLDLLVNPHTLIPRPETAELVDTVLSTQTQTQLRVLDIGTGSGCIAIALKKEHPDWELTAIDYNVEALQTARQNAERNHTDIRFVQQDILAPLPNDLHFDIVVSNPPYIAESEQITMEANVLDYEPASALFVPDTDPLLFYRRIASLRLARQVFFEINERLGQEVVALMQQLGYTHVQLRQDIYGKDRIVYGYLALD